MGLRNHVEPEAGSIDLHPVERPVPLPYLDAGLLEHFTPETTQDRFPVIDHSARRTPVRGPVLAPILHQEAAVSLDHDTARDAPTLDLVRW